MKYIFVLGGVLSGIGKGIAGASMGALLREANVPITMQKLDGYLNVDPGTMSPFIHGEVYVTDDGAETDLDLGHYERFIDTPMTKTSCHTAGQFITEIIKKERAGEFLGKDVQLIPDLTNLIKATIKDHAEKSGADVAIIEIGGTIGDFENESMVEAVRQMKSELGPEQTMFAYIVYLPYLKASKELKTRPAQHAVRALRNYGITPDLLFLRADKKITKDLRQKIAKNTDVRLDCVIPAPTIKSIYKVPLNFSKRYVFEKISEHFNLGISRPDLSKWEGVNDKIVNSKDELKIAICGKYNALEDAYISVVESIKSACFNNNHKPVIEWIHSEALTDPTSEAGEENWDRLKQCKGIIVPGGFGNRGIEGKIAAIKYAREKKIPFLGLCLGSQLMAIEFARNVAKMPDATSEEFDAKGKSKTHIVHFLPGKHKGMTMGGTLRLGAFPCKIKPKTLASRIYEESEISERHRHRFEFNNKFKPQLEKAGLIFSGEFPKTGLMEIVELKNHPFMIGSQFHPEFKSKPWKPHPLFDGLIKAALGKKV